MPNYTTLAEIQRRLNVADDQTSCMLTGVLDACETVVAAYLGYSPVSSEATEYYDTNGEQVLALKRPNVTAVASVYEDTDSYYGNASDPFPADSLLTLGTDYAIRGDLLVRINRGWPFSRWRFQQSLANSQINAWGCVKVTYTAGYTGAALEPFRQAVYMEAAALWFSRFNGTGVQQGESLDGYSYSLQALATGGQGNLPYYVSPVAERILRPFRRISFGGL